MSNKKIRYTKEERINFEYLISVFFKKSKGILNIDQIDAIVEVILKDSKQIKFSYEKYTDLQMRVLSRTWINKYIVNSDLFDDSIHDLLNDISEIDRDNVFNGGYIEKNNRYMTWGDSKIWRKYSDYSELDLKKEYKKEYSFFLSRALFAIHFYGYAAINCPVDGGTISIINVWSIVKNCIYDFENKIEDLKKDLYETIEKLDEDNNGVTYLIENEKYNKVFHISEPI